jgi:hypothetical protein
MAVYFCDVMDGLKGAFKNAGGAISGNCRLEKRGLPQVRDVPATFALGTVGGLLLGIFAGMVTDGGGAVTSAGIDALFITWGSCAIAAPLARSQLTSLYRASAHDKKIARLEAPKKTQALPVPSSQNNLPLI